MSQYIIAAQKITPVKYEKRNALILDLFSRQMNRGIKPNQARKLRLAFGKADINKNAENKQRGISFLMAES